MSATAIGETVFMEGLSVPEAEERVTEELAAQGFGVLTRIDVKATFKKKIDADFRPYVILGACNPKLAFQALSAASEIGLLLPCNVTVQDADGGAEVSIISPRAMFQVLDAEGLEPVVDEASERLAKVLAALRC